MWQDAYLFWAAHIDKVTQLFGPMVLQGHMANKNHFFLQCHSACDYQTWEDADLPWTAPTHKVTQPFGHLVLHDHTTNYSHCISTTAVPMAIKNNNLDYMIDLSFKNINRLLVQVFKYYMLLVDTKDFNTLIDNKPFSDQPVKNKRQNGDLPWLTATNTI